MEVQFQDANLGLQQNEKVNFSVQLPPLMREMIAK
jgi:hypothetical protein